MTSRQAAPGSKLIALWFVLDALLVLAPPLHWAVSDPRTAMFGAPASMAYFLSVSVFITLSVIFAYLQDSQT